MHKAAPFSMAVCTNLFPLKFSPFRAINISPFSIFLVSVLTELYSSFSPVITNSPLTAFIISSSLTFSTLTLPFQSNNLFIIL